MGVALTLQSFDDMFYRGLRGEPVIINDFLETSEEEKRNLNALIYTSYSGDVLSNLPSCGCEKITGEYNLDVVCDNCNRPVVAKIEQELEPVVWVRQPHGVSRMINPMVWIMLRNKFTKSGFNLVRWICDPSYKPKVKESTMVPFIQQAMQDRGISRGYNQFVEHFYQILDILYSLKPFRGQRDNDPLLQLLNAQSDCVFSDYLPLPNRALLVIESSTLGNYVDPIITGAVDAIRMMVGIDTEEKHYQQFVKERRTVKFIDQMATFYENTFKNSLAKKGGIFRKHVFGSRAHWSFRAVISSLTAAHRYDEVHVSWGIGVSLLRTHLVAKLLNKHRYTPNEALTLLNEYAQRYHPLLDELFKELIAESPHKGIPIILQRNPSLERGSAQALFITKVKTEVEIPTVSMSILIVKGYNADFDGDQLNGTLCIDIAMAHDLRHLAPHKSVFDLNSPFKVSGNLSMPKPVVATIANWIHDSVPEPDHLARLAKMKQLLTQENAWTPSI